LIVRGPFGVIVVMTIAGALGAACAAPPAPSLPASPDPTPVVPAADGPVAVTVLAKPWMPPWSGPGAPPEIAERAGLRFCGVEHGPGPIDLAIRECFVDSIAAGRDIEFARIETTIEGDPTATVYGFEPPDGYVMLVDSSQDAFGFPGWTVLTCASVETDAAEVFRYEDCKDGPVFR
jgi:hypothetical protein